MNSLAGRWSRRRFLETAGLAAALQPATRLSLGAVAAPLDTEPTHAFVAVHGGTSPAGIQVFASRNRQWMPMHFVPSVAPSAVLVHPAGTHLFVANARTRFQGLPTASVESWRIDPAHGTLTLESRQRLALASVLPAALALSPDGSLLVVAAAHGIFNILPVTPQGVLTEPTAVRKELTLTAPQGLSMHFENPRQHNAAHLLVVQDEAGTRAYRCTRDGMQPLPNETHAGVHLPIASDALSPPVTQGLQAVAYARLRTV